MNEKSEFGLISVIMAAYNSEKTIKSAIDSVLMQTYPNFELLIIDDCSADQTINIVEKIQKEDVRVKLIKNTNNKGVAYTRKRGVEEAKGKWIAILDSDDAWRTDKLSKQIDLQRKRNADLIYTGSAFMDVNGEEKKWYLHVPEKISYRKLLRQNVISNSSVLIRKKLYEEYYAESNEIHEDFAIWLKILKNKKKVVGIDEPLIVYRFTATSRTGNKFKAAKLNWNTYRYIGLNFVETLYYECCYAINGLGKYKKIKKN